MASIILSVLTIGLFAWLYARQQAQLYWPFRELDYSQFTKAKRDELSHRAHDYGLLISLVLCLSVALFSNLHAAVPIQLWRLVLKITLHFLAMGCTFTGVFDPSFAVAFGQKWYYLGDTAGADKLERRVLGKREGQTKFFICVGLAIAFLTIIKTFL